MSKTISVDRLRRNNVSRKLQPTIFVTQRILFYYRCTKSSGLITLESRNTIRTQWQSGRMRDVTRKWSNRKGTNERDNRESTVRC